MIGRNTGILKQLTSRETLFCRFYASCRNGREAAYRAGYTVCPEISAKKLLSQKRIREEIAALDNEQNASLEEVRAGLRRVAFASCADAVRLLLAEPDETLDIESLDLFAVSEIKRPKTGGMEIKFFDRIKALEKLGELSDREQNDAARPFYDALEKSAAALDGDEAE